MDLQDKVFTKSAWQNILATLGRSTEPLLTAHTESPEGTRRLALTWAPRLKNLRVLALSSDLGCGKTFFTSALASALGLHDDVASPTFTIVMEHLAEMPEALIPALYHFDVYRLSGSEEFYAEALDEYWRKDGICVIEWPERIAEILPRDFGLLRIELDHKDNGRNFELYLPE